VYSLLLPPRPKRGEGWGEGNETMFFYIISFLYHLKREKNKEKKFLSPPHPTLSPLGARA